MYEYLSNSNIKFLNNLHFGFREEHGATPAIFALKECISY